MNLTLRFLNGRSQKSEVEKLLDVMANSRWNSFQYYENAVQNWGY